MMPVQNTGAENPRQREDGDPVAQQAVRAPRRDDPEDGPERDREHLRAQDEEQGSRGAVRGAAPSPGG